MPYVPLLGGATTGSFPLQFPNEPVTRLSLATTPIEQLSNDGSGLVIGHGTGFIWKSGSKHFLVTARHVLSGRDPFSDDVISSTGYIPSRIRISPCIANSATTYRISNFEVSLKSGETQLWMQDPDFDSLRTDIAAIEIIVSLEAGLSLVEFNTPGNFESVLTPAGSECSILGYPTPNLTGMKTPVWRSGTIASEPSLPIDGKPMFLIDASTSPGLSGAPVVRRHFGPAPIRKPDGQVEVKIDRVLTTDFIGVYAGRLQHAHYGGEIPFAFYGNRIEKIVAQPSPFDTLS